MRTYRRNKRMGLGVRLVVRYGLRIGEQITLDCGTDLVTSLSMHLWRMKATAQPRGRLSSASIGAPI
jgi:hypothetical protein